MPVRVNFDNTQTLTIKFVPHTCSYQLLFTFPDGVAGRKFLAGVQRFVCFGTELSSDNFASLGITSQGLSLLRPDWTQTRFESAYVEGPDPVHLGDLPGTPSHPDNWWERQFRSSDVHCLVTVFANEAGQLESFAAEVTTLATAFGLTELFPRVDRSRLAGQMLPSGRLHFGYLDGLSSLPIAWDDSATQTGDIDLRHFVLGYSTNEIESYPRVSPLVELVRDSSYVVMRWLRQDVASFNAFLTKASTQLLPNADLMYGREVIAAKLMGRWRDGTPLVLSPTAPNSDLAKADFTYDADVNGNRCPFSAHIRVVNPRNQPLDSVAAVDGVPRVIRRGTPYGPPLAGDTDDGRDRGLVGLFICSNIRRQFYTLTKWINRNTFSPVFDGDWHAQDGIAGSRRHTGSSSGTFRIPSENGNTYLSGLPDFLQTKGTLFLLLPSRSTLSAIYA